jgi:hypothetical protein
MPYDSSLDESLFSKSCESDTERLTVSIYSYNGGEKKLQLSKESRNASGEFRFGKLGRMSKEQLEAILPLMQEALTNM